jgi:hypothetical protein
MEADDELLVRARRSMNGGRVSEEVRREIMASTDDDHERARRLIAAISGVDPIGEDADESAAPKIRVTTSKGTTEIKPRPSIKPPATSGEGGTPSARESEEASKPRLAVLTRIELSKKGKGATLRLRAAQPVEVGMVEQKSSGTVRLVARSAGALPAVLESRPSSGGVTVTDVRRGEGTIQIALRLDEGWRASAPRSDAAGASISFRGR